MKKITEKNKKYAIKEQNRDKNKYKRERKY
jgi:hypothetical protein